MKIIYTKIYKYFIDKIYSILSKYPFKISRISLLFFNLALYNIYSF